MNLLRAQGLQYVYDIAAHLRNPATAARLAQYGVTDFLLHGTPEESYVILLTGSNTWREITRTPRKNTIPQTVIGAYTHAALPLTSSTLFAWLPNEALAIAANNFAYPESFLDAKAKSRALHQPSAIPRVFREQFDPICFDKMMLAKRSTTPYLFVEPSTYETRALPDELQPTWHYELRNLQEHFFWHPRVRGARAELLILPEAEYVQGLLRARDIIHSLRVTGRGWSLLRQVDVMAEYTRAQNVLDTL